MSFRKQRKLRCPFCKSELTHGPLVPYETLIEHVEQPNEITRAKPTLICPCTPDVFWEDSPWGDMYITATDRERRLELRKNYKPAIGSGALKYEREKARNKIYHKFHISRFVNKLYIIRIHIESLIRHHRLAGHPN